MSSPFRPSPFDRPSPLSSTSTTFSRPPPPHAFAPPTPSPLSPFNIQHSPPPPQPPVVKMPAHPSSHYYRPPRSTITSPARSNISSPSVSPTRSSRATRIQQLLATDPLLARLTPLTIQQLSAAGSLDFTVAEKEWSMKAADGIVKVGDWIREVEGWGKQWPKGGEGKGFLPPDEEERKRRKIAKISEEDESVPQFGSTAGVRRRLFVGEQSSSRAGDSTSKRDLQDNEVGDEGDDDEEEYYGSVPRSRVEHFARRIGAIQAEIADLDIEGLKGKVLSYRTGIDNPLTSSAAIITATTLQLLPPLHRLTKLLSLWAVRLAILRIVPIFLRWLQGAREALDSGILAINLPSIKSGESKLDEETFALMSDMIQQKVATAGRLMDTMLDALEGREDVLPDDWICKLEETEEGFSNWQMEAERVVLEGRLREESDRERAHREKELTRLVQEAERAAEEARNDEEGVEGVMERAGEVDRELREAMETHEELQDGIELGDSPEDEIKSPRSPLLGLGRLEELRTDDIEQERGRRWVRAGSIGSVASIASIVENIQRRSPPKSPIKQQRSRGLSLQSPNLEQREFKMAAEEAAAAEARRLAIEAIAQSQRKGLHGEEPSPERDTVDDDVPNTLISDALGLGVTMGLDRRKSEFEKLPSLDTAVDMDRGAGSKEGMLFKNPFVNLPPPAASVSGSSDTVEQKQDLEQPEPSPVLEPSKSASVEANEEVNPATRSEPCPVTPTTDALLPLIPAERDAKSEGAEEQIAAAVSAVPDSPVNPDNSSPTPPGTPDKEENESSSDKVGLANAEAEGLEASVDQIPPPEDRPAVLPTPDMTPELPAAEQVEEDLNVEHEQKHADSLPEAAPAGNESEPDKVDTIDKPVQQSLAGLQTKEVGADLQKPVEHPMEIHILEPGSCDEVKPGDDGAAIGQSSTVGGAVAEKSESKAEALISADSKATAATEANVPAVEKMIPSPPTNQTPRISAPYDDGMYHPDPRFDDGKYHPNPMFDDGMYHPNPTIDDGMYHSNPVFDDGSYRPEHHVNAVPQAPHSEVMAVVSDVPPAAQQNDQAPEEVPSDIIGTEAHEEEDPIERDNVPSPAQETAALSLKSKGDEIKEEPVSKGDEEGSSAPKPTVQPDEQLHADSAAESLELPGDDASEGDDEEDIEDLELTVRLNVVAPEDTNRSPVVSTPAPIVLHKRRSASSLVTPSKPIDHPFSHARAASRELARRLSNSPPEPVAASTHASIARQHERRSSGLSIYSDTYTPEKEPRQEEPEPAGTDRKPEQHAADDTSGSDNPVTQTIDRAASPVPDVVRVRELAPSPVPEDFVPADDFPSDSAAMAELSSRDELDDESDFNLQPMASSTPKSNSKRRLSQASELPSISEHPPASSVQPGLRDSSSEFYDDADASMIVEDTFSSRTDEGLPEPAGHGNLLPEELVAAPRIKRSAVKELASRFETPKEATKSEERPTMPSPAIALHPDNEESSFDITPVDEHPMLGRSLLPPVNVFHHEDSSSKSLSPFEDYSFEKPSSGPKGLTTPSPGSAPMQRQRSPTILEDDDSTKANSQKPPVVHKRPALSREKTATKSSSLKVSKTRQARKPAVGGASKRAPHDETAEHVHKRESSGSSFDDRSGANSPPPLVPADELDRRVNSILQALPSQVKLTASNLKKLTETTSKNAAPLKPWDVPRSSIPAPKSVASSGSAGSQIPSMGRSGRRHRSHVQGEIKLYHLHRSDGLAPIKLYIRLVGQNGERVMVRVGGGWADLAEYLTEYAMHHGTKRRSISETQIEVHDIPSSTTSTHMLRPSASNSSLARTTSSMSHYNRSPSPAFSNSRPASPAMSAYRARTRSSSVSRRSESPLPPSPYDGMPPAHSTPATAATLDQFTSPVYIRGGVVTAGTKISPVTPTLPNFPPRSSPTGGSGGGNNNPSGSGSPPSRPTSSSSNSVGFPSLHRRTSRLSFTESVDDNLLSPSDQQPLGLAGPRSRKVHMSPENQAWVEGMIGQVRKVSGNATNSGRSRTSLGVRGGSPHTSDLGDEAVLEEREEPEMPPRPYSRSSRSRRSSTTSSVSHVSHATKNTDAGSRAPSRAGRAPSRAPSRAASRAGGDLDRARGPTTASKGRESLGTGSGSDSGSGGVHRGASSGRLSVAGYTEIGTAGSTRRVYLKK